MLREFVEVLLVAAIFALFVRTFVVQAFNIPSGSMEENLLVGDHLLVNKFIYGPTASALERALLPVRDVRRGDVVVFKYPDDPQRDYIKRCVGLPGDEVDFRDKELYVNGQRVDDDSYVFHDDERIRDRRDNFGPFLVPPGSYFCVGDNRDNSRDSRFWQQKTVPTSHLKGRAVMIYWSFDSGAGPPPGRSALQRLAHVLSNLPSRTRWERTFQVVR